MFKHHDCKAVSTGLLEANAGMLVAGTKKMQACLLLAHSLLNEIPF